VLIVTGTKRSGTSLWMQILIAAGFPAFGEAFPGEWRRTLSAANTDGFYESLLREGIYYATNPHPKTGDYFFPEQVEWHCVKVFIPGLIRSDRAYIGRVIATVRNWREHEASVLRLRELEKAARDDAGREPSDVEPLLAPPLEWWSENFALIRDISIRRHAVHVQSFDGLLADPERIVGSVFEWLGRGDVTAGCGQVRPDRRHFERPASQSVDAGFAAAFDELYDVIHSGKPLSPAFLQKLNDTNSALAPLYDDYRSRLAAFERRGRERAAP
jgi:uncharacterized protein YjiS (DUF1127 family)